MALLTPEIKAFIREHADADPSELALQAKRYPDLPMAFIAQQVKARRRMGKKLPTWVANEDTVFPTSLSLEQCSSESVARYRAQALDGKAIADLTGGFGVDAMAFSERFDRVYHIERDDELSAIALHNAKILGQGASFVAVSGDGLDWLKHHEEPLDALYVDPARRDRRLLKVSALEQCEPNLAGIWDRLIGKAPIVAAKLSPGLDIDALVAQLPHLREIHVVSIGDECKELFCIAERGCDREARIICARSRNEDEWTRFEFLRSEEKAIEASYAPYSEYLYEPNASIRKAGAFKSLGKELGLPLLHPRTHFYSSDRLIDSFPGRIFEVVDAGELRPRSARRLFADGKANVLARNAGMDSAALKRKLGLSDGGDAYAIGLRDVSEKRLLLKCRRLN